MDFTKCIQLTEICIAGNLVWVGNPFKRGNVPHTKGTKCDFSPDKVDVKYSRLTSNVFSDIVDTEQKERE